MTARDALLAHLRTGTTTVARCFALTRADGIRLGFTDHDADLSFGGIVFRAGTGMTAKALAQSTGLSVDNTEAFGALSSDAITEVDIAAGRYDGAEVEAWLVNWHKVGERMLQFRGTIGDLTRTNGAFTADLRGLAEALNQPQGRIYHPRCSAVLGDRSCKVDLSQGQYFHEGPILSATGARSWEFDVPQSFGQGWFVGGRATVVSGVAAGVVGWIKDERQLAGTRRAFDLWHSLGVAPEAGDTVRIEAGCDKRDGTCRAKFQNFLNFRGFPDIPGEDWMIASPHRSGRNDGGSRRA